MHSLFMKPVCSHPQPTLSKGAQYWGSFEKGIWSWYGCSDKDQAASDAHFETPYFKKLGEAIGTEGLLAGALDLKFSKFDISRPWKRIEGSLDMNLLMNWDLGFQGINGKIPEVIPLGSFILLGLVSQASHSTADCDHAGKSIAGYESK